MPDYNVLYLGGHPLYIPYSTTNQHYSKQYQIVTGRQATSLAGTVMQLGIIYKCTWEISFFPRDNLNAIMDLAVSGEPTTFIDIDGEEYTVFFLTLPRVQPYPYSEIGLMFVSFREE